VEQILRLRLVIGDAASQAPDGGLLALIAEAFATREMFFASGDDSVEAVTARLGVRRDYLAVRLRLSYLAPRIVRAILLGAQPCELTPTQLVALSRNLPCDWEAQHRLFGISPA
jgi:site-specific DNA recombinase